MANDDNMAHGCTYLSSTFGVGVNRETCLVADTQREHPWAGNVDRALVSLWWLSLVSVDEASLQGCSLACIHTRAYSLEPRMSYFRYSKGICKGLKEVHSVVK